MIKPDKKSSNKSYEDLRRNDFKSEDCILGKLDACSKEEKFQTKKKHK